MDVLCHPSTVSWLRFQHVPWLDHWRWTLARDEKADDFSPIWHLSSQFPLGLLNFWRFSEIFGVLRRAKNAVCQPFAARKPENRSPAHQHQRLRPDMSGLPGTMQEMQVMPDGGLSGTHRWAGEQGIALISFFFRGEIYGNVMDI